VSTIKFGTSGWRGIMARDFTFDNLALVTQATADYLKPELEKTGSAIYGRKPVVILGYDTRFLAKDFTLAAAEVLHANGLIPLMTDRDTPTPAISFVVRQMQAIAAINLTASHNPCQYQGFKFNPCSGAPAPPEITNVIEANIQKRMDAKWSFALAPFGSYKCKTFDPKPAYFEQIRKLVDLEAIKRAKLKVAVDFRYGTGRGYLDTLLKEAGAEVIPFRDELNPLFGGHHLEPDEENMREVSDYVRSGKANLGLGLDGDADRFGIVDQDGRWLSPNIVLALTLHHLKKNRGWTGAAVRSVVTSHFIDAVAGLYGVKVHETPVGFKYTGALMEQEPIIVGGEESGGLSVKGHIPEKDGILACLLMAELVATEKKSLGQILKELEAQTGVFYTDRINVSIPPEKKSALLKMLDAGLDKIGPFKVLEHIKKDGSKFVLPDGEWVAMRASGTEPLIRCYIEAHSQARMAELQSICRALLTA
jgi:alpha-D-glucose phosphate-specific phosphoglucomutase